MAEVNDRKTGGHLRLGAIVTGSSSGIGEAIAKKLACLDYELVITGRSCADVERVASDCESLSPSGLKPLQVVADLEDEREVDRLFESAMCHLGDELHLLVNNAGFGLPVHHSQVEECYATFKRILQVNLNAVVRLTLLAAPVLKSTAERLRHRRTCACPTPCAREPATCNAPGGVNITTSVVNIGSIAGIRPAQSLFAYGTSKAALKFFSESMAVELSPLVRVNTISPGPILTKIVERSGFSTDSFVSTARSCAPLKRIGVSEEVAECVAFLADSHRASYVTGANIVIDGGVSVVPLAMQSEDV